MNIPIKSPRVLYANEVMGQSAHVKVCRQLPDNLGPIFMLVKKNLGEVDKLHDAKIPCKNIFHFAGIT